MIVLRDKTPSIPGSLIRGWRRSASAALGIGTLFGAGLAQTAGAGAALRWAAMSAAAGAYLLWEFRRNLHRNARPGESKPLPELGAGTILTLFRGLFAALLAGFLAAPPPEGAWAWAPALLYLGVALADFFDGYLARVRDHVTELGGELDMIFDAFGTLAAAGVLVLWDRLPAPFLAVGLLYYLFHGHMKLRRRSGKPVRELKPNPYRRMYAGFMFGYLVAALAPLLSRPWIVWGGVLFVGPVVAGFAADWLAAVGFVDPESAAWRRFERRARRLFYRALPAALRAAALAAGGLWLARGLDAQHGWAPLLGAAGLPEPATAATLVALLGLVALGMTAAAFLGRSGALALVALVSLDTVLRGAAVPVDYALLTAAAGILLLGTGRGVIWVPEDELLLNKAGAPRAPSGSEPAAA